MKSFIQLILFSVFFLFYSPGRARSAVVIAGDSKVTVSGDTPISITAQGNGKYSFTYQNEMPGKKEQRIIVFKNKKDAKSFVGKIGKALSSKDGDSKMFTYANYRIRLLSEMGGVFMIVDEKGLEQATLRISREMYSQINIL